MEDPVDIKRAVFRHFQQFYRREVRLPSRILADKMVQLKPENRELLEKPVSEVEIWSAVMAIGR